MKHKAGQERKKPLLNEGAHPIFVLQVYFICINHLTTKITIFFQ